MIIKDGITRDGGLDATFQLDIGATEYQGRLDADGRISGDMTDQVRTQLQAALDDKHTTVRLIHCKFDDGPIKIGSTMAS